MSVFPLQLLASYLHNFFSKPFLHLFFYGYIPFLCGSYPRLKAILFDRAICFATPGFYARLAS